MKILAIMGSPKGKGGGYRIVKMVEERLKRKGEADFEYVFLKDANLAMCKGCFTCVTKGEDKCPLKDDRAALEAKMLASDGIILSSPTYVMNVSWPMKNFIDRFAYTNHRLRFFRQKVLLVANSGGSGLKETTAAMRHALGGSRIVHELHVGTPPWAQTEKAVANKEKAIDAAAEALYRACQDTALPVPSFNDLMRFTIQKNISEGCRQWLPADYEYYHGKDYHYVTKVNPVKAAAVRATVSLAMSMMKDMGPGNVQWPPKAVDITGSGKEGNQT